MTVAGDIILGEGTVPVWAGAGQGHLFFDDSDGQLYFRRSDTGAIVGPLGAGGGGAVVGPSNAVFVDVAGNNGTAVRGDRSKPFLTYTAALAACLDGDTIFIGPGHFPVPATPVPPVVVTHLSILGSGRDVTFLDGAAGVDTISLDGIAFDDLVVSDLTSTTLVGGKACLISGATVGGIGNGPVSRGITLSRLRLLAAGDALNMEFVGRFALTDIICGLVSSGTGDVRINTCGITPGTNVLDGMTVAGSFFPSWDDDHADKPGTRSYLSIRDLHVAGSVSMVGQPLLIWDDCTVDNYLSGQLTEAGSGATAESTFNVGRIGTLGLSSGCSFTGPNALPDSVGNTIIQFFGTALAGDEFSFSRTGGVNGRSTVSAFCCAIQDGMPMLANNDVDIVVRPTSGPPFYQTTGNGSVNPGVDTETAIAVVIGPNVIPFTNGNAPFTAPVAPLRVFVTSDTAGMDAIVTARAANGVIVNVLVAGNVDVRAEW